MDGERFDVVAWLESMRARDATSDDVKKHAPGEYHLANLGGVWDTLGWLWPHCPRWYLAFSDPVARTYAREIIDLRRLVKMGLAGSLGEELTPAGFDLLAQADRLWDKQQSMYEREQMEAAQNERR